MADQIFCIEKYEKGRVTFVKCNGYRLFNKDRDVYRKMASAELKANPAEILDVIKTCEYYDKAVNKYPFHNREKFIELKGYYLTDTETVKDMGRGLPKKMLAHILVYLNNIGYEYLILHAAMKSADAKAGRGLAKVYAGQFGMDLLGECQLAWLAELGPLGPGEEYPTYYVGKIKDILGRISSAQEIRDIVNLQSIPECLDYTEVPASTLQKCHRKK